jgi:hypothetical protein
MNYLNFSKVHLSQKHRLFSRHFLQSLSYSEAKNSPLSQNISDEAFFDPLTPFQEKECFFDPHMDPFPFGISTYFKEEKRRRFSSFKTNFYR